MRYMIVKCPPYILVIGNKWEYNSIQEKHLRKGFSNEGICN